MTKVLAVDDHEADLRAIEKAVSAGGGIAKTALLKRPAEERGALKRMLSAFRPDFCIVDAHFGAFTDGLSVIRAIRDWNEEVPVVLCTGFLDEEATRSKILAAYQKIRHLRILSKNPPPTWDDFCVAAGLPKKRR